MKRSYTLTALLVGLLFVVPYASAQTLTVFAASSLTEAFEAVASVFERQHSGVNVLLSFDGSSTLATQITQGAPADVFASADEDQLQVVVDAGLAAAAPQLFATNRLVVITTKESDLTSLEALAEPGVLLVLAAPEVPVGNYAREALKKMNERYGAGFSVRVLKNLVSEESNVRQVALKIELGEADAAIVYATDAAVAKNVKVIPIPGPINVVGTYSVVALKESSEPELAEAFVKLVRSSQGQAILKKYGFGAP